MLFLEGTSSAHLYTVLSGWAFRYKLLPDGRRQILNYCFPGDFIGLQGSVMNEMQHSIEALSDMVLCVFQREGLWRLFEIARRALLRRHVARSALRANPRSAATVGRTPQRAGALRASPPRSWRSASRSWLRPRARPTKFAFL